MLELKLRLQANEKKGLEDAPRLKFGPPPYGMLSRTTWSITLTRAASKMYVDDHQMYVAGEKMEEMERTLTDEGE